ncbi:MAG: hypothetical protein V9G42_13575 [Bacteroidia bacterium]|jgi:hypothetical protein
MKSKLVIILIFVSLLAKGQYTWEFTNKLYVIDNIGKVDSVLFGNDSSATIGIDPLLGEQNIISLNWDSLDIRSIHRVTDTMDCPINYWNTGIIFNSDMDLKIDIRKSVTYLDSSTFFVFKINAKHYPIEIYSDFSDMYNNSMYNIFTVILKHQYQCLYVYPASCVPNYQYLFTINDSTERYITIKLDFETGINESKNSTELMLTSNPVQDILKLNYSGRLQIFQIDGTLIYDLIVEPECSINISNLKAGIYILRTDQKTLKMIKI